jgi:hypothetical protein
MDFVTLTPRRAQARMARYGQRTGTTCPLFDRPSLLEGGARRSKHFRPANAVAAGQTRSRCEETRVKAGRLAGKVPRRCVTCSHEEVEEINRRLRQADREPLNLIAARFGLSDDAMERHAARHLARLGASTTKSARVAETAEVKASEVAATKVTVPSEVIIQAVETPPRSEVAATPAPQSASEPVAPAKPLSPQQAKTRFLEVLAEYGSMSKAAKAAGVSRSKVHRWLEDDEVFGFAYKQSLAAATEGLEEVARERATRGARIERQIWRAGRLIETVVEYRPSDTALITLLKAQKPDVYRERVDQNVSGEVSVRYTNDWRSAPSVPSSTGSA